MWFPVLTSTELKKGQLVRMASDPNKMTGKDFKVENVGSFLFILADGDNYSIVLNSMLPYSHYWYWTS
jgi:hypothetical protein